MKRYMGWMLVLGMIITGASQAGATVLQKLDLKDLSLSSDVVVRGVVAEVKTEQDSKTGRVYTYNTIQVREAVKGQAGDRVVVRQLGGTVGNLTMRIPGTPEFKTGEEVLLFLQKEGDVYFLRGMGQGYFAVQKVNGVETAVQNFAGASVLKRDEISGQGEVVKPDALRLPVGDLVRQVRSFLIKP